MKHYEGRHTDLKNRVNIHLGKLTGKEIDFFSSMKQSDFMELKTVLADINNVLTLKMTIAAAGWLCEYFNLDKFTKSKISDIVDGTKPNSKGFDICILEPYKILAEVKCLSPINNGNQFGVAQHDSIMNDAHKLLYGKDTFKQTNDYLKFIFLIDLGDRTNKAISQLLKETKGTSPTALKYNSIKKDKIEILNGEFLFNQLTTEKVYIKKLIVD